jgi:deoxyribonuclease V
MNVNMLDNPESYNLTPQEAVEMQNQLRSLVSLEDDFGPISRIAGIDVSIGRGWETGTCGIVVLSYPEMRAVESTEYTGPVKFPYIPGLLAFREMPLLLMAFQQLKHRPDILFLDGQGYAHPRRFGLACNAGVALGIPAVGIAKSRLIGSFQDPGREAGSTSPLVDTDGERIGDVLRTKDGVKPIFVSPGHRISFESATRVALECVRRYRVPEPTRLAHNLVSSSL